MADNHNKADIKSSEEKDKIKNKESLEKEANKGKEASSKKGTSKKTANNSSSQNTSSSKEPKAKDNSPVKEKSADNMADTKDFEEIKVDLIDDETDIAVIEESLDSKEISAIKDEIVTDIEETVGPEDVIAAEENKDEKTQIKPVDDKDNDDLVSAEESSASQEETNKYPFYAKADKNAGEDKEEVKETETVVIEDNYDLNSDKVTDDNKEASINLEEQAKAIEDNISTSVVTSSSVEVDKEAKKKSDGSNKFSGLVSKYKLPIIIVAVLLVIALAVSISVAVANRNLVNISSAEDFLEKKTEGKTTYVLKKDIEVDGDLEIPNGMNINMNGKTLTVGGALKYSANAQDKDIFIGEKNRSMFLPNGKLIVSMLEINSPNASLIIYCEFQGNMDINIKSLAVENKVISNDEGTISISADDLTIKGEVIVKGNDSTLDIITESVLIDADISGEKTSITISSISMTINGKISAQDINFINCGEANNKALINNDIIGAVSFVNSFAKISEDSGLGNITADSSTSLDIYGKVLALEGGLLVIFRDKSSGIIVKDVIELRVYEEADITSLVNIGDLILYEVLSQPHDITINQEGSSLMCYVSKVNGADKYILYIDGNEKEEVFTTNILDITSYITQPKTYAIGIKAVSDQDRLLASSIKTIDYTYNITLNKPNIAIDPSDGYKIVFNSVPFASEYKYSINNGDYISHKGTFIEGNPISIDITDKITHAGEFTVKIIAYGQNPEAFKPSDIAQTSFVRTIKLDPVSYDGELVSIVREERILTLAWDRVTYAKYYSIFINDNLYSKTKNDSVKWTLGELEDNDEITIIVDAYSFYTASDAVKITYQSENLDSATISTSISNKTVTVSWEAVNNATSYKVFLDSVLVDEVTSTSYSVSHTPASSGLYTVEALADYFNSSISNSVLVGNPILDAPQLSRTIESGEIKLIWSAVDNAETYFVYLDGVAVTAEITSTTYTIAHVPANCGQYYVIAMAAGYNNSAHSNSVNIPPPTLEMAVLDYEMDSEFTWTAVENATSYDLYREGAEEDELIATTTSTSINIAPAGGNYYILAKADGYNSSYSNVITIEIEVI